MTPACAGTTGISARPAPLTWDDPRVCGDDLAFALTMKSPCG